MKGIILAGGSGTRLYPMTKAMSKQMLPVYDKPMVYYPLSILMLFGIRDILIISTPEDTPVIERLLGDGAQFGINLSYKVQPSPDGLAQAFILGEEFIAGERCAMILGDNIFYTHNITALVGQIRAEPDTAFIFGYKVHDPERFGIIEFGEGGRVLSIEEKPKAPKSNYAAVGLYFYPGDVASKARQVKPSARGELEITDLSAMYLKEGRLKAIPFGRGSMWLDAGTPDSLMDASQFVQIIEKRQDVKIACLEEIALSEGFITKDDVAEIAGKLKKGSYADYLNRLAKEAK
ncbi:MAG: glucose-1-phosphate thymidylyltransferase RfbA [Rickettsiales bacterium]|jgi:glucose-1-phosphate thymidylyltransferase|nr:glucose-1-phosphate thymidylyltransferase RfbA [Rickettsiales bacterium]